MRTVEFTERVPAPDVRRVGAVLAAALVAGYVVLVVSALVPTPAVFLLAAVLVTCLEIAVANRAPFVGWLAGRVGAGAPWRGLVRAVAALVLLARADVPSGWLLAGAVGLLAVVSLRAVGHALAELVARQRKVPVVTRGLPLGLDIPKAPHPLLRRHRDEVLGCPDLLVTGGAAVAVLAGSQAVLVAGAVGASLLVALAVGLLAGSAVAMRRVSRARLHAAVDRALHDAAPEVALYFGSGPETLYQLEMWVETLERLEVPALLVLRDRESLRQLGPTRLPVLCTPHGTVLMGMSLPKLRLALYPAHATNNLHLLRRRDVRHVFVGHGDSDKSVTTNPFLKAYDEVWVSGPAASERFRGAATGLDDSRVVEIGRPQLDGLAQRRREVTTQQVTVLYAPTWEGYGDEAHQSSVGPFGVDLVHRLCAEPGVRVIYRPHPLAGTRDPAVRRAHRQILEVLGVEAAREPVAPSEAYAEARDDLEIAASPVQTSRAEHVTALDVWAGQQLMPDIDSPRHVVAAGPHIGLYACFAAADLLICDISSVITEFLATGRPYAVTNPGGLPEADFGVRYPSSRGGYLVAPDARGLDELLAAGRGRGDPAAEKRAALRDQLLGPAEPPALERMRKAVATSVSSTALASQHLP